MALSSQIVHQRLRATAQKFRWSRSARFLISGAALSLLFLVLFLTFDAWLHFGAAGRWTGFALTVSALVGGATLAVRSFRPQVSDASMARRIEQSSGVKGNVLINAVQFDGALAAGSPLRAALFSEMTDPFPGVQWDRVFDVKLLKQLGIGLAAVCVMLFGWAMLKPNYFANSVQRIFLPASNIAPLTRSKIEGVVPGSATVVHGREVQMTAMLGGEVPKMAWVHFRESGSSWQKTLMDREAGQTAVNFKWKDMRAPMDYYIEAGDATTATYHLDVRPKTAIKGRTAEIEPPAYTGLPKTQLKDLSLLQNVVPGSAVTMGLEFNNDVSELKVTDDKGEALTVEKAGASAWKVNAKIVASRSLKLDYRDAVGIADSGTMQVSVKSDEPPKVAVADPVEGKDLVATKAGKLTVKFSATDNFGLGSVAIYQSVEGREDAKLVQEFAAAKNQKTYEATAEIPLAAFAGDEDRVTFRIVARDLNDVTGPGVTMSRPIIVTLKSADKLEQQVNEAVSKLTKGLEALIKLQSQNLDETRSASMRKEANPLTALIERQVAVADGAKALVASADVIAPDVRNDLRSMLAKEMTVAVVALRNAGVATEATRSKFVATAIANEAIILARLQGAPAAAEEDAKRGEIADLISGVEDLLKQERNLHKETSTATEAAAAKLGERQDKLADKAVAVRKSIDTDSKNASVGDVDFRKRLTKVAAMFGEMKVYEEMLAAAEQLQGKKVQPAAVTQLHVVASLAKMVELLNQWQLAEAGEKADELKKTVEEMKQKLDKLAQIQHDIVEKTKDMARKDDFRKEDIATSGEIKDQKDLMKEVIEKMTTDLQALPDLTPGNEMRAELVSIIEDVEQADAEDAAKGKLKPTEIAVQKEQSLLDGIEAAKKLSADLEMWLPKKSDTIKWALENFDKTEMPAIPNVPLMDATEDIVGELQKKQEDIQEDVQDPSSNQLFAQNPANGWDIMDGPQGSFGAQGKSGNQAPNHNEQTGRSSGGREGESNGEMAGDTASNLEGDTPEARRTKDPLQQGQVKDDGGIGKTRATGGGKAGGFSDRQGMEGNAPLRATKAPKTEVQNAAAVQQALLAEKTAKTVAQASLLYIHSDGLSQVAKLMDESATAMKEGRMKDAQSLHQKIIGRLKDIKSGVNTGEVVSFSTQDSARTTDKQLLGGSEGDAPAQYKDQVSEYFRSLVEEK